MARADAREDDASRRGAELYDRHVRPRVGPDQRGRFVAIDLDSGAYEIDRDDFAATERLLARLPAAEIWLARIGDRAAYHFGSRFTTAAP